MKMNDGIVQREMNAVQALVAVNDEIEEVVVVNFDENPMAVGVYTRKLEACFKALGIMSQKVTHFGRGIAPAIMEQEEVCGMDQKNGNWGHDVYQKYYSTKLPTLNSNN